MNYLDNPWKGLNTYSEGEIIYGRNDEIQSLSLQIMQNSQTVLYGRSGIGKSSIINAGIFPLVRQNHIFPVSIRLEHNVLSSYTQQIKIAIFDNLEQLRHDVYNEQGEKVISYEQGSFKKYVQEEKDEDETLWKLFHNYEFFDEKKEKIVPLLVLDQFEEMFTLEKNREKVQDFFKQLADLINNIVLNDTCNEIDNDNADVGATVMISEDGLLDLGALDTNSIADCSSKYLPTADFHLVITLREDFLSYLERNTTNIPALKNNRFCLLPINEEQAAKIILDPLSGLVSKEVAKLIIEKVTDEHDFKLDGIPEISVDSAILSLYLSRIFDKMVDEGADSITATLVEDYSKNVIEDFYLEAIEGLNQQNVEYLENELINEDGRRDNRDKESIIRESHLSVEQIDSLTKEKKLLREFSYGSDLRLEYIHDVLCKVVVERRQRRIEQRHIEAVVKLAREKRRHMRRIIIAMIASILGLFLLLVAYYWITAYKQVSYYSQFERRNGLPVGIGNELSLLEREKTPLYYKLSHVGWSSYNTDVEVCSSNRKLPLLPRVSSFEVNASDINDVKAQQFLKMLLAITKIHFVMGENGLIDKEVVMDENDAILFIVNYFHLENGNDTWMHFLSPSGQPLQVRDNGVDRIKLSWDEQGRVALLRYFDELGVPKLVADGVYGYQLSYSPDERTTYRYALDEFGRPMATDYNVTILRHNKDTFETRYAKVLSLNDSVLKPAAGPLGYSSIVEYKNKRFLYALHADTAVARQFLTFNGKGNVTEILTQGEQPKPFPAKVKYDYDSNGFLSKEERLNSNDKPFSYHNDTIYLRNWEYSNDGILLSERFFISSGKCVYSHLITKAPNVTIEETQKDDFYIKKVDSIFNTGTSTTFFAQNNACMNYPIIVENNTFTCHRMVTQTKDNIVTSWYYIYNDSTQLVESMPYQTDEYNVVKSYSRKEQSFDKDGNLLSYRIFDNSDVIMKSMMYFYQNGQLIARAVMGIDGTPVRCQNWEEEGLAYYKLYFNKDFLGNFANAYATNEWDSASIFYDPYVNNKDKYRKALYLNNHHRIVRGESNNIIPIEKNYYQISFKEASNISHQNVPYLHILTKESPMYKNGLRDGDRIVAFGKWKWKDSEKSLGKAWSEYMKGKSVNMEVMRPTADGFECIKTTIQKNAGDTLPLEEYHIYSLTENEKEMFVREYERQ